MSPEDVKALRKELGCSAHQLATELKVDDKTIFAWESGELFPTKRHVLRMEALKKQGPQAFKRPAKPATTTPPAGLDRLRDPKLWELIAKLVAQPAFFDEVTKLAAKYPDAGRGQQTD